MDWAPSEVQQAVQELAKKILGGTRDPWTSPHGRVEGGSVSRAGPGGGSLAGFMMSQLYVKAGNILIPNTTWQVGTLDTYFGDLGLYDMRPAQIFFETVGSSARFETDRVDVLEHLSRHVGVQIHVGFAGRV